MAFVSIKPEPGALRSAASPEPPSLHPAWRAFIRYCRDLNHGEIEGLVIQDGLPVRAEITRKKVKFIP
jgi:cation transport ATPase